MPIQMRIAPPTARSADTKARTLLQVKRELKTRMRHTAA